MASSRFVLPEPFGPTMATPEGGSSQASSAKLRKCRRRSALMVTFSVGESASARLVGWSVVGQHFRFR